MVPRATHKEPFIKSQLGVPQSPWERNTCGRENPPPGAVGVVLINEHIFIFIFIFCDSPA